MIQWGRLETVPDLSVGTEHVDGLVLRRGYNLRLAIEVNVAALEADHPLWAAPAPENTPTRRIGLEATVLVSAKYRSAAINSGNAEAGYGRAAEAVVDSLSLPVDEVDSLATDHRQSLAPVLETGKSGTENPALTAEVPDQLAGGAEKIGVTILRADEDGCIDALTRVVDGQGADLLASLERPQARNNPFRLFKRVDQLQPLFGARWPNRTHRCDSGLQLRQGQIDGL
jgi:hypothetical protein